MQKLPSSMRQLVLSKHIPKFQDLSNKDVLKSCISVKEVPLPKPKPGQVLVKLKYASVNPSDLWHLMGMYGFRPKLPYGLGFEGSGEIVALGSEAVNYTKLNNKVGVLGTGIWAEYALADSSTLVNFEKNISLEQGACCLVNPLTALSFVDIAKSGGHKTFIHTAAASALGQMVIKEASENDIQVICIVRKDSQVEICKSAGASDVLVTSHADFVQKLGAVSKLHRCRLGFDAVGGSGTATVLNSMSPNSSLFVYGGLANEVMCTAMLGDLIFSGKTLSGFWLTPYLSRKKPDEVASWIKKIASSLDSNLASKIQGKAPLQEFDRVLESYISNMTGGKWLFEM